MDSPRNVTILSASDDSGITFTVTGTDESNNAQTEVITGADSTTATGTILKTVTQIATLVLQRVMLAQVLALVVVELFP